MLPLRRRFRLLPCVFLWNRIAMNLALARSVTAAYPEPGVGDPSQSEYLRAAAVDFAKRRRVPICPARCRVLKFP